LNKVVFLIMRERGREGERGREREREGGREGGREEERGERVNYLISEGAASWDRLGTSYF
jgi:hypothetical protein